MKGWGEFRREIWMVGERRRGNGRRSRGGVVFVGSVGSVGLLAMKTTRDQFE